MTSTSGGMLRSSLDERARAAGDEPVRRQSGDADDDADDERQDDADERDPDGVAHADEERLSDGVLTRGSRVRRGC
jgi:hypothetical protein